jgi:hypothetical protein
VFRFARVLGRIVLVLIAAAVVRIVVSIAQGDWLNVSVGAVATAATIVAWFWARRWLDRLEKVAASRRSSASDMPE